MLGALRGSIEYWNAQRAYRARADFSSRGPSGSLRSPVRELCPGPPEACLTLIERDPALPPLVTSSVSECDVYVLYVHGEGSLW